MAKKYASETALIELVNLIKTNLGLKVNTADIVNALTSDDANKPLAAAQGKALKALIDAKGDMLKSTYDPDNDGKVEEADHAASADTAATAANATKAADADKLGGKAPSAYELSGSAQTYIASIKGQANGLAPLGADGLISSTYLPSYVDDVLEGYYNAETGVFYSDEAMTNAYTGEAGIIYVDLNTNETYRYSGSVYIKITSSDMVEISKAEMDAIWAAAV